MYTDIRASACNKQKYIARVGADLNDDKTHSGIDIDVAHADVHVQTHGDVAQVS